MTQTTTRTAAFLTTILVGTITGPLWATTIDFPWSSPYVEANDGGTWTVDGSPFPGFPDGQPNFVVSDSAGGAPTTLNINDGFGFRQVLVEDSSRVDLDGGEMSYLWAYDTATLDMSGGNDWGIEAYGSAAVNISGGYVMPAMQVFNDVTVEISGGNRQIMLAHDNTRTTISAGYTDTARFYDSSQLVLTGGGVQYLTLDGPNCHARVDGGSTMEINLLNGATLDIYGGAPGRPYVTQLWVPGNSTIQPVVNAYVLEIINHPFANFYELRMSDGSQMTIEFGSTDYSIIMVPEPSSLLLSLSALAGLLMVARRRRDG